MLGCKLFWQGKKDAKSVLRFWAFPLQKRLTERKNRNRHFYSYQFFYIFHRFQVIRNFIFGFNSKYLGKVWKKFSCLLVNFGFLHLLTGLSEEHSSRIEKGIYRSAGNSKLEWVNIYLIPNSLSPILLKIYLVTMWYGSINKKKEIEWQLGVGQARQGSGVQKARLWANLVLVG